MKNKKIIVVNGFSRGGTNIVWNIFQSHPKVCSPRHETGQILFDQVFRWAPRLARHALTSSRILSTPLVHCLGYVVDMIFFHRKLAGNRAKHGGTLCRRDRVKHSVLCLKSVDWDIDLTELFDTLYEQAFFVGLIRNGFALCNGWIRRGRTAGQAGKAYSNIGQKMIDYQLKYSRYKLIRFEDVLNDPFGMASTLFEFAELEPTRLEKLRLKSKRVLRDNGNHEVPFGVEDRHYWFDSKQIDLILDRSVNDNQAKFLTDRIGIAYPSESTPNRFWTISITRSAAIRFDPSTIRPLANLFCLYGTSPHTAWARLPVP